MKITTRTILAGTAWLITLTFASHAGEKDKTSPPGSSIATEKILLMKTPWSTTTNPAALQLFDFDTRIGKAFIVLDDANGPYTRFQDARESSHTGVTTKGYLPMGRWKFYGCFNYFTEQGIGTKWVDVMEPFNGNPYSVGDSVGGNYSREYFKMEGKTALALSDNVSVGFDLQYRAGVGTKRKDPRPENIITRFQASPGIIASWGKLKLGAHLRYEGGKEDIEFTSVTGNKFELFYFRGLGAYSMTMEDDGRYSENHLLGGGLQLSLGNGQISNVSNIDFSREETDIKRGSQFPLQLVMLEDYTLSGNSVFVKTTENHFLNRLKISFEGHSIYGTEPVVEPKPSEIHYQWSTAAKYTLYWQKSGELAVQYNLYKMIHKDRFDWGFTVDSRLVSDKTDYYFVPEYNRQKINVFQVNGNLEKSYRFKRNELIFGLSGGYRGNLGSNLSIIEDEKLLQNVLVGFVRHDFDYRVARNWETGISVSAGRDIQIYSSPVQLFIESGYRNSSTDFKGEAGRSLFYMNLGINY